MSMIPFSFFHSLLLFLFLFPTFFFLCFLPIISFIFLFPFPAAIFLRRRNPYISCRPSSRSITPFSASRAEAAAWILTPAPPPLASHLCRQLHPCAAALPHAAVELSQPGLAVLLPWAQDDDAAQARGWPPSRSGAVWEALQRAATGHLLRAPPPRRPGTSSSHLASVFPGQRPPPPRRRPCEASAVANHRPAVCAPMDPTRGQSWQRRGGAGGEAGKATIFRFASSESLR
jgi:hypothetical protein